jgi:hypothetical protein
VYVHGIAKVPDDSLGAQPASLEFIRVAPFAMQQLLVADGHAAPANPVLAVAGVNMVEIGQDTLSEYQIGCEGNSDADRLDCNPKELYDNGESM